MYVSCPWIRLPYLLMDVSIYGSSVALGNPLYRLRPDLKSCLGELILSVWGKSPGTLISLNVH